MPRTRTPLALGDARSLDGRGVEHQRGSRRALCLWLPTFELRLELVRSPDLDSTSVALLAADENVRRTIWQVSERAFEAGVRPGQLVSQAVSLCPSLALLEPDPAHYDAAEGAMLEVLTDFTPVVEPTERGRVFLGMDGLERLHGSPHNQVRRALRSLFRVFPAPLVAAVRAGWAPGKFGAWVAAASTVPGRPKVVLEPELEAFLEDCPVAALPVSDEMLERLERLGIGTLGKLSGFPEPALVGQFGREGARALAWATGRRIDPVRPMHRQRPIRAALDFPSPVARIETLHGAIDRLLEHALSRPARRGRSVLGMRLTARLEGAGSWSAEVVLREPSAERDALAFPLRSKLAVTPPVGAVEALSLELFQFGPSGDQADLFRRSQESRSAGRDLAQGHVPVSLRKAVRELRLKIGYSPLYRVVEIDPWSRIPERRHALLNFDPC